MARRESVRDAGERYQLSPCGRENHAARQRRYRIRQADHVTHQGSLPEAQAATVGTAATDADISAPAAEPSHPGEAIPVGAAPAIAAKDATHDESLVTLPANPIGARGTRCDLCDRPCRPFARLETYKCRARPFGRGCRTRASPHRPFRMGQGR